MAKNTKEDAKFVNDVKTYLCTITGRTCIYAYFNVTNDILLCNSTEAGHEHGNRLMEFKSGEVAVHRLQFKQREFIDRLISWLGIPSDGVYVIKTTTLVQILNKYSMPTLTVERTGTGEIYVTPDGDLRNEYRVGQKIDNFHVLRELYNISELIGRLNTDDFNKTVFHTTQPMVVPKQLIKRTYAIDIPVNDFQRDGVPLYTHGVVRFIHLDGTSAIANQKFVSKLKTPYTWILYAWAYDDRVAYMCSIFEDDRVTITSARPHVFYLILTRDMKYARIPLIALADTDVEQDE